MLRFRSHDERAEAVGDARLATYVLSRMVREWELRACRLGNALLQHGVDGAPHVTTGRMLPGRVAVLVPGTGPAVPSCNGERLDAGSLYRWGAGAEVLVQARWPGDWWLLSAPPEALGAAAVPTGRVRVHPEGLAELRRLFREAEAASERVGAEGLPAEAARRRGETLLLAVVRLCREASRFPRPLARPRVDRGRIVSRVEEVFAEEESRPVYVPALSARLGVPERTLRHVFAEQYGAGPTHVLRCRRLCQVHRALLEAGAGARVAEVAGRFGFRHLGQFASDYRELLGELPSETLRRREVRESGLAGAGGRWVVEPGQSAVAV